jgi:uncharacterized protein YggT (Ycf19 family)
MAVEVVRGKGEALSRAVRLLDYVFFLIYAVVGLRIFLELLGAREGSGFKQLLDLVSDPLLLPFKGLLPDPGIGPFHLMLSYMVGLIVYALVHLAIRGLIRLLR